jgi:hypothetical protein
MSGRELWAQYQLYTRDITEHGRKIGFAGCALCWVLRRDDLTFPLMIYAALLFFVGYFIADILQGVSGALMLKHFTEYHESKLFKETGSIEGDIKKPRWVDLPSHICFLIKCLLLMAGFISIGLYLAAKLV